MTKHGRAAWQRISDYTKRVRAEASISRSGDGLCLRMDQRRATEVSIAIHALGRMMQLGRLVSVRIA